MVSFESGTAQFFSTDMGDPILVPITGTSTSIASDPNGTHVALGYEDGSINIIDSESGEILHKLTGHSAEINLITFSQDGKMLTSVSRDDTVKVWDISTGEEMVTLLIQSLGITDVALSPEGDRLYAAASDGTVRVYLLDIDDLIALAYSRLTRWFEDEECLTYLHTETCPEKPQGLDF